MAPEREYQLLKIMEERDFPDGGYRLPSGYYLAKLKALIPEDEIEVVLADLSDRNLIKLVGEHKQIEFTQEGKSYFDKTYYKEQAYDMVDTALKKIDGHNDGINTRHRRYERISELAERIIDDDRLAEYLGHQRSTSMVKLLEEGYKVLEAGGIKAYLAEKENKEQRRKKELTGFATGKPVQQLFDKGQYYDAFVALRELMSSAKISIALIDNHVNERTLAFFDQLDNTIRVQLVTTMKYTAMPLMQLSFTNFKRQHGNLSVATSSVFHDRFLIIDDQDFYMIGASIMDAGNKIFMFVQIVDADYQDLIRERLCTDCSMAFS